MQPFRVYWSWLMGSSAIAYLILGTLAAGFVAGQTLLVIDCSNCNGGCRGSDKPCQDDTKMCSGANCPSQCTVCDFETVSKKCACATAALP